MGAGASLFDLAKFDLVAPCTAAIREAAKQRCLSSYQDTPELLNGKQPYVVRDV